jgi:hypothetical protein
VPARFKTAKQASAQLLEVRALEVKGEPPNKRNVEMKEFFVSALAFKSVKTSDGLPFC